MTLKPEGGWRYVLLSYDAPPVAFLHEVPIRPQQQIHPSRPGKWVMNHIITWLITALRMLHVKVRQLYVGSVCDTQTVWTQITAINRCASKMCVHVVDMHRGTSTCCLSRCSARHSSKWTSSARLRSSSILLISSCWNVTKYAAISIVDIPQKRQRF